MDEMTCKTWTCNSCKKEFSADEKPWLTGYKGWQFAENLTDPARKEPAAYYCETCAKKLLPGPGTGLLPEQQDKPESADHPKISEGARELAKKFVRESAAYVFDVSLLPGTQEIYERLIQEVVQKAVVAHEPCKIRIEGPFDRDKEVVRWREAYEIANGYNKAQSELISELERELAEAKEDGDLLDWLFQKSYVRHRLQQYFGLKLGESIRDAIRDAIKTIRAEEGS